VPLTIGLVWAAFWGIPLGIALYWRVRAKRVQGTLIGVRGSKDDYQAVYRYTDDGGQRIEASLSTSGSPNGLVTGSVDPLMVLPEDPHTVARSPGYLGELGPVNTNAVHRRSARS
jgi:hypothetical protein